MKISKNGEYNYDKKKRPAEIFGLKIKQLIPPMHIDATIGKIEFIEFPNKTIANQKHCNKNTLRININAPEVRLIFCENNCTLAL